MTELTKQYLEAIYNDETNVLENMIFIEEDYDYLYVGQEEIYR